VAKHAENIQKMVLVRVKKWWLTLLVY